MNIEKQTLKVEQQQRLIDQLTEENETLYQQFNHLMIRNNKLLKRIDDQQRIIDDLHLRVEELQLISSNQLRLNDHLRTRVPSVASVRPAGARIEPDPETLFEKWKSFPGQTGQNTPNLRKQVSMLLTLYGQGSLTAAQLFAECGVGGVTGARYVAILKKSGLIRYSGARKKGHYELTAEGIRFVEKAQLQGLVSSAETSRKMTDHSEGH